MPDEKKWYNSPQHNGKNQNRAKNPGRNPSGRPSNAPANAGNGKRPVNGSRKPVNNQGSFKNVPGKQAPGSVPSQPGNRPVNRQGQPLNRPVNRQNRPAGKKRVNPNVKQRPVSDQGTQQNRPVNPAAVQQNIQRKPVKGQHFAGKKRPDLSKKSNLPYPEDYVAKKHAPVNEGNKPNSGKRKLTPEEKRKKYQKLAEIEQAKIEGRIAEKKNPSQKSAQNRAVRNGVLGLIVVVSALLVLSLVVHHLYDYIAEKPRFAFVTM